MRFDKQSRLAGKLEHFTSKAAKENAVTSALLDFGPWILDWNLENPVSPCVPCGE